jgi:plasmid stability protein
VIRTDKDGKVQAANHEAMLAREAGRYEDALRHLLDIYALVMADGQEDYVGHLDLLEWIFLIEVYPPARDALSRLREEQARRLLDGDVFYGVRHAEYSPQPTRFGLVAQIGDILKDARATYELFVRFDALMPEQARREAFIALPAVVEAGDFELGERFLPDPMGFLPYLNEAVGGQRLFTPTHAAPRLLADLFNFAKDLRLRAAILRGRGRDAEARALVDAALAGLATEEMRGLVSQDLEAPGAIIRALTAHQMAQDEAASQHLSTN